MTKVRNPWAWIPTLYFAEGLPYFIVNVISVTMFKRMGMSNGDLALYTSLLYLPWTIKPLWSPFVDIIRSKRWWILTMQFLMAVAILAVAFTLPHPTVAEIDSGNITVSPFIVTLIIFYITAFASATHDIAADGYYMLELDKYRQSLFVGLRNTFYRIGSVFGQGVIVVIAGSLETAFDDIPKAWSITLLISAIIFGAISLYHSFFLPRPEEDMTRGRKTASEIFIDFGKTFATFFRKKGVWLAIIFMLLYRLPEAFSVKMLTPFMLDPIEKGGLGLTTTQSGLVYGTVGVIALLFGGILGGIYAAKKGLRKSIWPMAMSLALPCSVYLYMAIVQPESIWQVYACVAFDQFGYGFGFTAYMLYMMYFADGEFKTSHYAICTAFMAFSMMIPGMFAGYLQEALGYVNFFWMVMICCLATVAVTYMVREKIKVGSINSPNK
ncbi:MAG: MFS transporter [Prevotellaceae bacterium]|nr:MFS transporter [Candidatus Colivivens equi]